MKTEDRGPEGGKNTSTEYTSSNYTTLSILKNGYKIRWIIPRGKKQQSEPTLAPLSQDENEVQRT
jgi:hypothetical protein